MMYQNLYRRGYSTPLPKCITKNYTEYVLKEIHEGICGSNSSTRTITAKVLRVDYYWSTIQGDCA